MDLLSIALILLIVWLAIVFVALAVVRARAAPTGRPNGLPTGDESGHQPHEEPSPLDALAEEIMRSTTVTESSSAGSAGDRQPAAAKRFKQRSRLKPKAQRIKNLLH